MANSSKVCYLLNIDSNKRINLPHEETKILGRNIDTEVQDLFVSKNQVECTADLEKNQVKMKPIGRAISGIDGYAVTKDKMYTVTHGQRLELRLGYHEFEVKFEPPPDTEEEGTTQVAKKLKIEATSSSSKKENGQTGSFSSTVGWKDVDRKELLVFISEGCKAFAKVAAFDMDGTIIKTKSGARFPKNADDWEINFREVPKQLKKLHEEGFKVVFFTNQQGVGKDPYKIKDFKRKVENIISKLSVPIQAFAATGKTIYRKPAPGMWNYLIESNEVPIDVDASFYVGDAAGREKNWAPKKNKDHSMADRLFAMNIGLKFYTPEEYFLKARSVAFNMPEFDPRQLPVGRYPDINYNRPNAVLMVGGPGSGKSYFCKKVLISMGYIHINRDKLGTWQKCVKAMREALENKSNCVIDNTNPDKESRARFVAVAREMNVSCYCFVMETTVKHMKHNNKFRELTDPSHVPVSDIIINSYKKNVQEPELGEGFVEIVRIPFVADFDNAKDEKLYKMFLLEK